MTLLADYYQQPRGEIADLVPSAARRVLDVGCAAGVLGRALLERGVPEVIGIEIVPEVAELAGKRLTGVICGDVATMPLPGSLGRFDCMIFGDVLEHMADPAAVLQRLLPLLTADGTIIASIPNVRHHSVLNMLAEGNWTYEDSGILDRTHLRFFTLKEIRALFEGIGLEIHVLIGRLDAAYEQAKAAAEGRATSDVSFGRLTLRAQTPSELAELHFIQYVLTARRRSAAHW